MNMYVSAGHIERDEYAPGRIGYRAFDANGRRIGKIFVSLAAAKRACAAA